jgi:cell division protein FtsQ
MLRAAALPRAGSLPRPPRVLLWIAAVAALLAVGFLWFRDSSFVRVEKVTVTGLSGPEAPRLRALLTDTARDMSTLHVREQQLRTVVEPYPIVKGITITPDFPHGLRIAVRQNQPVAAVVVDGQPTPVAADGVLLRGATKAALPEVPVDVAPGGDRVTDRRALAAIAILGAAPAALLERVEGAAWTDDGGVTLTMANGPQLRFGGPDRPAAKWAAAAAVLADADSAGATYLDLRYPERPAAGGLEDPATQRDPAAADVADVPATTTPGAAAASATSPSTGGTP